VITIETAWLSAVFTFMKAETLYLLVSLCINFPEHRLVVEVREPDSSDGRGILSQSANVHLDPVSTVPDTKRGRVPTKHHPNEPYNHDERNATEGDFDSTFKHLAGQDLDANQ
jgi:hypothetical protein